MTVAVSTTRSIRARRTGFHADVFAVSVRALKSILRDTESVLPALVIPVFFFAAIVGAMKDLAETVPGIDYTEFQVPVAIIFAVTGIKPSSMASPTGIPGRSTLANLSTF